MEDVEKNLTENLSKDQLERVKELAKFLYKEKGRKFTLGYIFGVNWFVDMVLNDNNIQPNG